MKIYIIPIIIIALSLSCRKEINIDIPDNERKIVLNTIVMNDSVFSANVFRSNHINDDIYNALYLNNATVNVLENGNLLEILALDTAGYYKGTTTIAQEGHEYEINVSVPNLESVKAKAKLLPKIPIISIDSTGEYVESGTDGKEYGVLTIYQVSFQDPPNEKNYYRLKVNLPIITDTIIYDSDTIIYTHTAYTGYKSEDPSIEVWDWIDGYFYFSDLLFDGDEYKFDILIEVYFSEELHFEDGRVEFNNIVVEDISISLEHISNDLFNYMKSVDMQYETQGMEMFFQAVPVFINVENGFGILGTANASKEPLP